MKKRWIIAICILLVGILLLSACSSSKEEEPKDLPNYTLQLDVTLEENIIFSTYDVEIAIDGEKLGTVKQGETFTKELVLSEGKHEFQANKSGDTSVKGTTTITLDTDKAFSCSLKSHNSNIDINNQLEEALAEYTTRKEKEQEEAEAIAAAEQEEKEKKEAEEKAAKEKEEAEKKEQEEAEARREEIAEILVPLEGEKLSDVYDTINSVGVPVKYIAINTEEDMTSAIADVTESYYVYGFYWDNDEDDTVAVYVVPDYMLEQAEAQADLEETLNPSVAWGNAEMYGKREYGDNFKLDILHMYGERVSDDGTTWLLKAPCIVDGVEKTCEAHVTGTTDDPEVTYFIVY